MMHDYRPQGRPERKQPGREGADINLRNLIVVTTLFLIVAVGLHFGLGGLLAGFQKRPAGWVEIRASQAPVIYGSQVPPVPRLRADPDELLARIKAEQFGRLRSYGFLDASRTAVHIPIERAKALLRERGLPDSIGPVPAPRPGPQTATGGQINVR